MIAYITELNSNNYEEFTKEGIVLVDIWAEWCNPCKTISPIVDKVSADYHGKVKVGKLEADLNREIVSELGIRNIPTLLVYKDGEIVDKLVGSVQEEKITESLDSQI
jgi:thioredoxin 1